MTTPWTPYTAPPDLSLALGRLLERSEATITRLDRIDRRLEAGETRMDEISERIAALEAAKAQDMPALERAIKSALPYLIGGLTLWLTGSAETALKLMASIAGAK